jgi:hypothetical protein
VSAPYVPPHRTWRSRLREVVTERLGLKAIALLLAVLLWLVVHTRRPAGGGTAGVAPLLDAPGRAAGVSGGRGVAPAPAPAPASDSTVAATP